MSRHRWWAPIPFPVEVLPHQQAALGGFEHARVTRDLWEVQREHLAAAGIGPMLRRATVARDASGPSSGSAAGRLCPGLVPSQHRAAPAARCSGPTPQQPPMICAPSSRQLSASLAYSSPPMLGSWRQPAADRYPRFGYDTERKVGEVTQPRQHPGDVVGRHAVDRQRADAHLLEPARRATEGVALGPAPMLAVDAAHAVATAAEAQPHGQAGVEQRLDRRVRRAAYERQGLDRIRSGWSSSNARDSSRIVSRPSGVSTSPLMLNATATSSLAAGVPCGGPGEADGAPRHVHPVHRLRRIRQLGPRRGAAPSGRPQVLVEITSQPISTYRRCTALTVVGGVQQRCQPPQVLLDLGPLAADLDQLGPGCAIEDHAPVGRDQAHQASVSGHRLRAVRSLRGVRRIGVRLLTCRAHSRVQPISLRFPRPACGSRKLVARTGGPPLPHSRDDLAIRVG